MFALALGTIGLAACGSGQQPAGKPAAAAKPNAPEGIAITDGRLVLPAVKGNPGAVYFTVHNDSDSPATIKAAQVEGADSAMMHQTTIVGGHADMAEMMQADVPAKGELVFQPGGRHVMAMHLADTLAPGGTTDVTLNFANGDKATFPAEILAAGNAH